jgi:hypothetical protein
VVLDSSPPFEFVSVAPSGSRRLGVEAPERIFLYTVHDGDQLPESFVKPTIDREQLERRRIRARDWGANRIAGQLAASLGNTGYARAKLARVLLDLNRFPGTTSPAAVDPLDYFSIMEPFGSALEHAEKMAVLGLYDEMSTSIENHIDGSLISIGIHTYDAHNASETKRPDVSIITTPNSYLHDSRMPHGLFDPMYPDLLAESTCSRVLRDRISLNLERNDYRVSQNHPYPLPEGSIEVRAQVWSFFNFVKQRFELAHPGEEEDAALCRVWRMLLDTNLRDTQSEALRGYLHRYHRPSNSEQRVVLERARDAYSRVRRFVDESDVISDYRRAPHRPSNLAIEVRKDLLVSFDEEGNPLPVTGEQEALARNISGVIAEAIEIFLDTDRAAERAAKGKSSG